MKIKYLLYIYTNCSALHNFKLLNMIKVIININKHVTAETDVHCASDIPFPTVNMARLPHTYSWNTGNELKSCDRVRVHKLGSDGRKQCRQWHCQLRVAEKLMSAGWNGDHPGRQKSKEVAPGECTEYELLRSVIPNKLAANLTLCIQEIK